MFKQEEWSLLEVRHDSSDAMPALVGEGGAVKRIRERKRRKLGYLIHTDHFVRVILDTDDKAPQKVAREKLFKNTRQRSRNVIGML